MQMKYIIANEILPVIFHAGLTHSDFQHIGKITSAGFCDIYVDGDVHSKVVTVTCYGESISLKMKSKPENDETLIKIMINDV